MAPLHAHQSDAPHSHAVVHRHFEPHHHHDDNSPELEHGEHIVWLDMAVVHALPFQFDAPTAVLTTLPGRVVSARHWSPIVFDEAVPPHGPPRDNVFVRGPPARPA